MKILLIEREGTDLYSTLYDSDTSRAMLRFYHPVRHPAGVEITTASLGSALSLASELRWYIQRYVNEVLFTEEGTVYLTWSLAESVYERGATLTQPWAHRLRYRIHGGKVYRSAWDLGAFGDASLPAQEGSEPSVPSPRDQILEVWSTAEEHENPDRGEPMEPVGQVEPEGPGAPGDRVEERNPQKPEKPEEPGDTPPEVP
ncbi:MAG TPA: DUF5804 family protein [Methanomicrobiales archaeon]|jgi:hypothetical protein|nr:DUF5804 family protein [Methanomicrobiales archaeon]